MTTKHPMAYGPTSVARPPGGERQAPLDPSAVPAGAVRHDGADGPSAVLSDDDCLWLLDLATRPWPPAPGSGELSDDRQRRHEARAGRDDALGDRDASGNRREAIWRKVEARRRAFEAGRRSGLSARRPAVADPAGEGGFERQRAVAADAAAPSVASFGTTERGVRPRTRRSSEGRWWTVEDGIRVKTLHVDTRTGARSFLMAIAPGATYPAHPHHYDEECIVLEGDVRIGDECLEAGDYHLAPAGSMHGTLTSRNGALLFLRAGLDDTTPRPVEQAGILWRTLRDHLRAGWWDRARRR